MLDILPEGGELALHYRSRTPVLDERKDIREFDKARTLIVQWGHRDLSLLPFEMGRFSDTKADGSKLGFSIFMEQVIEAAALNLKPHELLELPRLLFASKSNPQLLRQIARMAIGSGSGLNRQKELEEKVCQIENAIAQATAEYLEMIFSHIVGQLTLNAYDTILLSGGSSLYFCEIEELLQIEAPGAKVFIDEDLVAEIATQISGINEVDAYRAADAYGIMLRLLNKVQQQAEKVEKKSSPRLPNLADSKRQSKSSARVQ